MRNVLFQLSYDRAMAKFSRGCTMKANACIFCSLLEYLHILEDRGAEGCSFKRKNEYATVVLDVSAWWMDDLWHTREPQMLLCLLIPQRIQAFGFSFHSLTGINAGLGVAPVAVGHNQLPHYQRKSFMPPILLLIRQTCDEKNSRAWA